MRVSSCFGGGATSASRQEERDGGKRACRPVFFFTPEEVSRSYPIGTKQNVNKTDRKLHQGIFAADSKIQSL